jgi:hypothetical protein
MRWMEACYGGIDVMELSCAVARGIDINRQMAGQGAFWSDVTVNAKYKRAKGGSQVAGSYRTPTRRFTAFFVVVGAITAGGAVAELN